MGVFSCSQYTADADQANWIGITKTKKSNNQRVMGRSGSVRGSRAQGAMDGHKGFAAGQEMRSHPFGHTAKKGIKPSAQSVAYTVYGSILVVTSGGADKNLDWFKP